MKTFYQATNTVSTQYTPTISFVLVNITAISKVLVKYKKKICPYKEVIETMVDKFYFFCIPQSHLTATLFNSFYEEHGVMMMIQKFYNNLEIGPCENPSVETCCDNIIAKARSLYNLYQVME